jgi:folate-binding protein YgfZ
VNSFFDLSPRIKLRIIGADRERYLNGQLTNDVRKANETIAIEACALNAKGKLNAHLFLTVDRDAYLLDADPELGESLQQRLERYIIADDVQIEEVSAGWSIFHLLGVTPPVLTEQCKIRSAIRFGETGYDIWSASERHDASFRVLSERFQFCDVDCAEVFRIEKGIPRWGRELTEEIIPIEANLEARAIDYEKGCYIGQEVISRMKMSGQTNKRLCGLTGEGLKAGMKLFSSMPEIVGQPHRLPEPKEVGWVASADYSRRLSKQLALGFVRRGFNSPGTKLRGIAPVQPQVPVAAEIVEFPLSG